VDSGAPDHLFVYGSLRAGREEARLLEPFERSRRQGARVRGVLRRGGQARARARFDPRSETAILGEVVELDPDRLSAALDACLQHAHDGYALATVEVELAGAALPAWALEWAGPLEDGDEHLAAALEKIKIAHYHCHRLAQVGQEAPRDRVMFQAHAEGVLAAAGAAGDELARGLDLLLDYGLEPADPGALFDGVANSTRAEPGVDLTGFRSWWDQPIVRDAAELRRLSTPHRYERSPRGLQWVFAEVALRGDAEPYLGPRGVLGYCVKYVSTLESLEQGALDVRSSVDASRFEGDAGPGRSASLPSRAET
jgi:gamma-glutamylcyclotransferase (GGCT)/AIG2-like uncharacterized protein YtfP